MRPTYTYRDYLLWEGDWEMIDGVPHAISPSASGKHQWIASLITTEFVLSFRSGPRACGDCISVQDVDWVIDDYTVLRPDLAIICYPMSTYITSAPSLVVEILSPSSGHHDRIVKHEIYEEQKVPYYIIIDPVSQIHQAFHLSDGKYKEYKDHTFTIHDECNITIDFPTILASLNK
jgi:Uma2 family endonuclease